MADPNLSFDLTLSDAEADPQLLEELTGYMLEELQDLGVDSVERVAAPAPPGRAKGDGFTLGALALVTAPALLPALVTYVREWTMRGRDRVVKIKTPAGLEIEFTPDKPLSQAELMGLVQQLSTGSAGGISPSDEPRTRLRQFLVAHFSKVELKELAFDLGVNFDELEGEGTANKSLELVDYLRRRGRLQELEQAARARRPNVSW